MLGTLILLLLVTQVLISFAALCVFCFDKRMGTLEGSRQAQNYAIRLSKNIERVMQCFDDATKPHNILLLMTIPKLAPVYWHHKKCATSFRRYNYSLMVTIIICFLVAL